MSLDVKQHPFDLAGCGALRRLQKMPHIVRGFFADPDLRYITA
jgi:hypothetical protein